MDDEVRVTDPNTGGEKGSKLARFDLLPFDALWEVAEQYGRGAEKYDDRNWERGYDWGLSLAALHRHLAQFWNGEDTDEETGGLHMAAAAWHALALLTFQIRGIGTDTRPKLQEETAAERREVDDGFGNVWKKCFLPECDLHVVRPGKVQCSERPCQAVLNDAWWEGFEHSNYIDGSGAPE